MCPISAFVSKYSKNIVLDVTLLNVSIPCFILIGMYIAGGIEKVSSLNYFGMGFIILGLFFLNIILFFLSNKSMDIGKRDLIFVLILVEDIFVTIKN